MRSILHKRIAQNLQCPLCLDSLPSRTFHISFTHLHLFGMMRCPLTDSCCTILTDHHGLSNAWLPIPWNWTLRFPLTIGIHKKPLIFATAGFVTFIEPIEKDSSSPVLITKTLC